MKRFTVFGILFTACAFAQTGVAIHDAKGSNIGVTATQMLAMILGPKPLPGMALTGENPTRIELNSKPENGAPGCSTILRVWSCSGELQFVRIELKVYADENVAFRQFRLLPTMSAAVLNEIKNGPNLVGRSAFQNCANGTRYYAFVKGRTIAAITVRSQIEMSNDQLSALSLNLAKMQDRLIRNR